LSIVKIQSNASGTGTLTIAAPNTNSDRTLTLPDATGTVITNTAGVVTQTMLATGVAGNGPAFSAYQSASTSLTTSVATKILFATEEFDTNSNFSSSRFTPTVAGYYQVSACMGINTAAANLTVWVYKNGAEYKSTTNALSLYQCAISCLVYCNGSTDYLEIYGKQNGTTQGTGADPTGTYFQAAMVRAA